MHHVSTAHTFLSTVKRVDRVTLTRKKGIILLFECKDRFSSLLLILRAFKFISCGVTILKFAWLCVHSGFVIFWVAVWWSLLTSLPRFQVNRSIQMRCRGGDEKISGYKPSISPRHQGFRIVGRNQSVPGAVASWHQFLALRLLKVLMRQMTIICKSV